MVDRRGQQNGFKNEAGLHPSVGLYPCDTPNSGETAKIIKDLVERGEAPLQYFLSINQDKNESKQRRKVIAGGFLVALARRRRQLTL